MQAAKIRLAKDSELDDILELDAVCLPGCEWDHENDEVTWVALVGSELVGYASARTSAIFPGFSYLSRVGVAPQARGAGLQKRFIRRWIAWTRKAGLGSAMTYTINNPPSGNSLIACGFRLYYPGEPYDENVQWWFRDLSK